MVPLSDCIVTVIEMTGLRWFGYLEISWDKAPCSPPRFAWIDWSCSAAATSQKSCWLPFPQSKLEEKLSQNMQLSITIMRRPGQKNQRSKAETRKWDVKKYGAIPQPNICKNIVQHWPKETAWRALHQPYSYPCRLLCPSRLGAGRVKLMHFQNETQEQHFV